MRSRLDVLLLLMFVAHSMAGPGTLLRAETPAKTAEDDPWEPVRFIIGKWEGAATGESGTGTSSRTYDFVLANRFIHERNTSTYLPRKEGQDGEVHEHWSFFSYDQTRKLLRLRQFHQESFVVSYVLNAESSSPQKLVFESEEFENFDNKWRARETYEVVSPDEFVETFELAPPGQPFEIYSRTHFKRVA